jgi:hypothetical protein
MMDGSRDERCLPRFAGRIRIPRSCIDMKELAAPSVGRSVVLANSFFLTSCPLPVPLEMGYVSSTRVARIIAIEERDFG